MICFLCTSCFYLQSEEGGYLGVYKGNEAKCHFFCWQPGFLGTNHCCWNTSCKAQSTGSWLLQGFGRHCVMQYCKKSQYPRQQFLTPGFWGVKLKCKLYSSAQCSCSWDRKKNGLLAKNLGNHGSNAGHRMCGCFHTAARPGPWFVRFLPLKVLSSCPEHWALLQGDSAP